MEARWRLCLFMFIRVSLVRHRDWNSNVTVENGG